MRGLAVALLLARCQAFAPPAPRALLAPGRPTSSPRAAAAGPLHASPVDVVAALPTQLVAELENAVPIDKSGWYGGIVQAMESVITFLHDVVGSYGIAIVLFTLILKVATFPLNKAQIESTTKMQALQPAIKKIQATYAADPDKMNMLMAQLYQENELNPLAGCLPSLLQIPVFIALYRSILNLAFEKRIGEGFLWLPNLEGPTYDNGRGLQWLTDNWVDGVPPLGWHDTLCFLALPAALVVAQTISMRVLSPPPDPNDKAAQNANRVLNSAQIKFRGTSHAIDATPHWLICAQVLKYLPLMIGYFSANVPSGLGLYWMTSNVFSVAGSLGAKAARAGCWCKPRG